MLRPYPKHFPVYLIVLMRALAVGLAYYVVADIPGLTSSFVAIFVAFLPFDLIVAMPRFSLSLSQWRELLVLLAPRLSATAITLAEGLVFGTVFGVLTLAGLPHMVGAVLTVGLAYSAAQCAKGNISSLVAALAGIALFEKITVLETFTGSQIPAILGAGLQMVYATFTALFAGWFVGILLGVLTRLLLPRGYRSAKSLAYAQPLTLQPFKDVVHFDEENMVILRATIEKGNPLVGQRLADSRLRSFFQATVLSIFRRPRDVVAPRGSDCIEAGDALVLLVPPEQSSALREFLEGSTGDE